MTKRYGAKLVLAFENAWSFQLFQRKLSEFRSLPRDVQFVCLVPPSTTPREVQTFTRLFDFELRGFNEDSMEYDRDFDQRRQDADQTLGKGFFIRKSEHSFHIRFVCKSLFCVQR